MLKVAVVLICALFLGCGEVIPDDRLVHKEVNQKNPGGKDLVMTFREISREERTSLAKVTHQSGASVPSIMFLVNGFYAVAKARKANYFINLKEWDAPDGDRMYLVGFANDANVSIKEYFQFNDPPTVPDRHEFLSVKEYAKIFE